MASPNNEVIPGFIEIEETDPLSIAGFEGIAPPHPFEIPPEEEDDPAAFYEIDLHTGRQIPILGPADPPSILQVVRDYLGIHPPETTPLDLEAIERGVRPFDVREDVFGTGREEELRRVVGRGFAGITGGVVDLVRGYEERPETLTGSFAGGVAEFAGFILGPFRLAKALTGARLAPTSTGLRAIAQILREGGATLGLATGLSSIAPALMESDTLTDVGLEVTKSAAMGFLIGVTFPAMGNIENPVLRVAMTLAVIDRIRAFPQGQWFTIDDVVTGVIDGTIPPDELGNAAFGYTMDIYFALKVPSMRRQLAALDNAFLKKSVMKLDVEDVEATLLELSRRGEVGFEPQDGITKQELVRSFGSKREFDAVADRIPAFAVGEKMTDAQLRVGKELIAESQTRALADQIEQLTEADKTHRRELDRTLIQVVKEQGGIAPSRAFSKDTQKEIQLRTPGIIRKKAPMQMDQMAEFLRREQPQFGIETAAGLEEALRGRLATTRSPSEEARLTLLGDFIDLFPEVKDVDATPEQIVKAIRKDKNDPIYRQIIELMKEDITEADVRFMSEEAGQPGEEGFKRFADMLEELAVEEGIEARRAGEQPPHPPDITPPAPPGPPLGPPEPLPSGSIDPAKRVEAMYNKTDAELQTLRKQTFKKVKRILARSLLDTSSEVKKRLLNDAGDQGVEAVIRHDNAAGMGAKSERDYSIAEKDVFGELNKAEEKLLERIIQSRRTIAIDSHAREVLALENERVRQLLPETAQSEQAQLLKQPQEAMKHPDGLGMSEHTDYLLIIANSDPALFRKLNARATKYFDVMFQQLIRLRNAGLITEKSFVSLAKVGDYSPRRFIQHIDPVRTVTVGGKLLSVPNSGLRRLEAGSERVMEMNARLMMNEVITRTNKRIAVNETNQAAWQVATQVPEQEIFKVRGKGRLPAGKEEISVMIRGIEHKIEMDADLAGDWVLGDPAVNTNIANVIGWLSGSKILKPMATGLNPEFALTNFPRDILHVWVTTHEYSPHIIEFGRQMKEDLAATRHDAFFRTGQYVDAINEGLGMNWLTMQGNITTKLRGNMADIQKTMGYFGETSEVWVRLALRRRAILNGKPAHEATWIARNYLDFAQGGWAIKAIDTGIPYLNASVQATRGVFRAAKQRPGATTYKFAQLGTLAMGLYIANTTINKDAWDSVPTRDKNNNFVIVTPWAFTDDEGNRRWFYFTIAKDQTQRLVASAFEGMMGKMMGHKVDGEQIAAGFADAFPILPTDTMPPTLNAIIGYWGNKDFWRNEDIWRGDAVFARDEWTNFTHPALKKFGSLTGLSPERTGFVLKQFFTYGNIYTSLVSSGTEQLMRLAGEEVREQTTLDLLTNVPGIRRALRATNPFEPFRKEIEDVRIEDQSFRLNVNRDMDKLSDKLYKARAAGKDITALLVEVEEFIDRQRPDMQEGLLDRFIFAGETFRIPDRRFWLNIRAMSPEARAQIFWNRYMQTPVNERDALMDQAEDLTGIVTERFVIKWLQLRKNSKDNKLERRDAKEKFKRTELEPTGRRTRGGRQIFKDLAGRTVSEISATIELNGDFVNIPTIFEGKIVSVDEALKRVRRKGRLVDPETGRTLPVFKTQKAAEAAAEKRSRALGGFR